MTPFNSHVTCLAFVATLVFLASPSIGLAQQAQPVEVQRQFKITTTDAAGKRIVHEVPDTTTGVPALYSDTVKVKDNWSKLQKGFSESDVEKLLGVPSRMQYDEATEYWWYGDRAVLFNVITHKVSGWDK